MSAIMIDRPAAAPGIARNVGIELVYDMEGEGAPLLLIAGLFAERGFWSEARPGLTGFRTIAFDNRDVGASGLAAGPYSIADMARDARAVLDAAGIERAHVLGHSMGGAIAQEMALRFPERVDRLVLVNSWARSDLYASEVLDLVVKLKRAIEDEHTFLSVLYSFAFGQETLRAVPLSAVARQVLESEPPQDRDGAFRQADACRAFDALERIAAIRAPTLVLHTRNDRFFAPALAEQTAQAIPGARLQFLDRAGHCPMIETPGAFVEAVASFLAP